MRKLTVVPLEHLIFIIRGMHVMLDRDIAELYGVKPIALRQQVARNRDRFPSDFMFQLTKKEKNQLITDCDRLAAVKHSPVNPYVFTQEGVAMLSSVLRSPQALQVNIAIMRAFVRMKSIFLHYGDLAKRFDALEIRYDARSKRVFDAIRALMASPAKQSTRISGFANGTNAVQSAP